MAGRPPTPIGLIGRISTKDISPDGADTPVWAAECRIRDADGVSRRVRARGRSRSAAETALKKAVAQRQQDAGVTLTGATKLRVAAEQWLAQCRERVDADNMAPRTLDKYESVWRLHLAGPLGELRLREATTARCEGWQVALRRRVSAEETRSARAVLSGILGYAARMDAIATNPVRDLSRIPGQRTRQPRQMTVDEIGRWLEWLDTHASEDPAAAKKRKTVPRPRTAEDTATLIAARALGDITRLQLATGARIGEVMAVGWDEVDLQAGTVDLCWHMVRVKGEGLQRMSGRKRGAGLALELPSWAVEMLMRRRVDSAGGTPVFPDELGNWRDHNQVMRWLRWERDAAGFPWLTSRVYRQTVITYLDSAGLPTREIADQAGHAAIAQTQQYMQRRASNTRAAEALEQILGGPAR